MAIEMAQQLINQGHRIGNVILLDTRTPNLIINGLLSANSIYPKAEIPPNPIYQLIDDAHDTALRNYAIGTISFPISLIRAEKTFNPAAEDESLGWSAYMPDFMQKELQIYPIMSGHDEMLKEESLVKVADIISQILE